MTAINKHTGHNIPEIKQVQFVLTDIVLSEDFNLEDLTASVSLKSGQQWDDIYFTEGSLKADIDKESKSNAGIRYDNQIVLRIPKDRIDLARQLHLLSNKRCLLRVTSRNDNILLIGSKLNPVQKKSRSLFGKYTGYELTFFCSQPHPCLYLSTFTQQTQEDPPGGED